MPCPMPEAAEFHRTFLTDVARRGRVHEVRMMGEYNLRSGDPLHNAQLAPKMLLRRRLHLFPPRRIKGFKSWLKRLMKKT